MYNMSRAANVRYNSRAYLFSIRNVDRGLRARDLILSAMKDGEWYGIREIATSTGFTLGAIRYHLRNMERDSCIEHSVDTREWRVVSLPQAELTRFIRVKSGKRRAKRN